MRYIIRPIISNILLFIEALVLFILTLLLVLKTTVLSENHVIKQLEKTNYYETVYNESLDTMMYITKKDGFSGSIIKNTFTTEDIKKDINLFVESFYKGETVTLNTEHLKENITNNLEQYIETNQLEITEDQKQQYINKMISTYKNEIRLMNKFTDESKKINKYNKIINTFIILFMIDIIVLIIINKKIFNKTEFLTLSSSSALALTLTTLYLQTLNLKNIFIYNNVISEIIKKIIKNIEIRNLLFILLYIIISIVFYKKQKEKTRE